jgi:tetratricopeptide (TPR) repeat protein
MIKKITLIYVIAIALFMVTSFMLNLFNLQKRIMISFLTFEGNTSYQNGAYDDAEVYYKKALKELPGLFYIQYNLGNAYYKQERYAEAVKAYKQALKVDEGSMTAGIWNNLGNGLYTLQQFSQSAEAYRQALLLNRSDRKIRQDYLFVVNKLGEAEKIKDKNDDGQTSNDKNKSDKKDKDNDKSKTDKDDKLAETEISDKNIKDIFKLISQNEDETRGNVSKSKHKVSKIETGAPDY